MEKIIGFLIPTLIYLYIFILNSILPGRWVKGYVSKTNSKEKLNYHLNGLQVLIVVVLTWFFLGYFKIMPWDFLYQIRWYALAGAICFGLVFSLVLVLPNAKVRKSFLADFYFGRLENPQLWGGRIDTKMWLYLIGAVYLELNVLSFTAHHYLLHGSDASNGIVLTAFLLTFFVVDYLTFEEVHLYTYDFFAERVGFKLGWGCIAFYPFFYAIPLWATVNLAPIHLSTYALIAFGLVFFTGWSFSRGANLQKYNFKKDPSKKFLGIQPELLADGNNVLLVNGFWGVSRHVNYLGEILMAVGIVLCTGHAWSFYPWLYPLYYVALLFPRQQADNLRCSQKYGPLWDEYTQRVPYRIIPYIY